MSKTLILEFNLSKEPDTRRYHGISSIKQLAEDGGQYYTRWVLSKDLQQGATVWESISAIEAEAIRREHYIVREMREARRPEARNTPKHSKGDDTGGNHLEMAIETLRNMSDGDGPEAHLFAIGLGLVALVERADLALALATRSVTDMEEIAASLKQYRRGALTPEAREVEWKVEGRRSHSLKPERD